MKRIEAIIRPTKVGKVCAALEKSGYPRVNLSQIENRDPRNEVKYQLRGKTYKADLMIKSRIEVIVEDIEADEVVNAIMDAAFTGDIGDGEIFVHSVENSINISAGKTGDAAA